MRNVTTHPYHPFSTPLGFSAALAPKVLGASLSLGFEPIILSVRAAVRQSKQKAMISHWELCKIWVSRGAAVKQLEQKALISLGALEGSSAQDGIDQAPPFRSALHTTFC